MKIAVIFHRFGPYHIARLNALASETETVGIELSGETDDYKWEKIEGSTNFKRITVFPLANTFYIKLGLIKKRLFSILNEVKPNVIAINGYTDKGALLTLDWCLKNKTKKILMSESSYYDEERKFFKEYIKRHIIKLFDSAMVGGSRQKEYLVTLDYNPHNIFYGCSVVDNDYFESETARLKSSIEEIKKKNGIKRNFFLSSARFLPRKNLENLLRAYKYYLGKSKKKIFDLVILGDGPEFEKIKSMIKELALADHIHLPGFLQYDQITEFYTAAKVFIHPSSREQWGLVVNEAMASGLPIIVSSKCGCAPDLVKDGINGYTFDPEKPEELSELMLKVTNNDELREEMGGKSKVFMRDWSTDLFGSNIIKAAETALKSKGEYSIFSKALLKNYILFKASYN